MPEPDQIRCVHCGQTTDDVTADHVFPKSWYPSTTAPEVQRWTVPSCGNCNKKLGAIENKVFNRLALCADPRKVEAAGLSAKVMRSLGIGVEGLNVQEAEHRRAQKRKIFEAIEPYRPGISILPGFGPHPGFGDIEQFTIRIPADLLHIVAEKIVRGCEFVLAERIVEKPFELQIYFAHEREIPDLLVQVLTHPSAKTAEVGPGFSVIRAEAQDEPGNAVYKINVWDTLVIYASILSPPDVGESQTPGPEIPV